MIFFFFFSKRLTHSSNITRTEYNIHTAFLVKYYLYNFTKIKHDKYINLLSLLREDEQSSQFITINNNKNNNKNNTTVADINTPTVLNIPCFKEPSLLLYKYFQFFNEPALVKKGKLLDLLQIVYRRHIREYKDTHFFFFNNSLYIKDFVFNSFLDFHKYLFSRKTNKRNHVIINEYSLYTDFFVYSLDFYLFHLSKNVNVLNVTQLNALSRLFANVGISENVTSDTIYETGEKGLSDGITGHPEKKENINQNTKKNENENENQNQNESRKKQQREKKMYIMDKREKQEFVDIGYNKEKEILFEKKVNNKLCLLYIYISQGLINQTYAHIQKKIKGNTIYSLNELIQHNVQSCRRILYQMIHIDIKQQYRRYLSFENQNKKNEKLVHINILQEYLNSIKLLNIINIKKQIYIIIYLYYNSFLFNKSIYYSALIFYILQKYNMVYTFLYNILLIKFNLFFWNQKTFKDSNKLVLLNGVNKFIDSIIVSHIKKRKQNIPFSFGRNGFLTNSGSTTNSTFYDIYKEEFEECVQIIKDMQKNLYEIKGITNNIQFKNVNKKTDHLLMYSELCIYHVIKYVYKSILWKKEIQQNNNYQYNNKNCFVLKKYNHFYSSLLTNTFLSNFILLICFAQTCLPLLSCSIQNSPLIKKERRNKRKTGVKKDVEEVKKRRRPFYNFLSNIYDLFRHRTCEKSKIENAEIKEDQKIIKESTLFNNITKNKNNKIQTSLTHYYISSNLKKLLNVNLQNEKNICTFFCDIYFDNQIIEVDGPKHFLLYYATEEATTNNYFYPFLSKNKDIFEYELLFPFFFNDFRFFIATEGTQKKVFYFYNDLSLKKHFFLYIYGYFIKHINYNDKSIFCLKRLFHLIYKQKSEFYI